MEKKKYCKEGNVRFNLKSDKGKTKNCQIFMIYSFDGKRLRTYSGKRIDSNKWDKTKQKVKPGYSESAMINDYLKSMAIFIEETYTKGKIVGDRVSTEYLKSKLNERFDKKSSNSFFDVFENFITSKKSELAKNTIKKYVSTQNHLREFSEKKKVTIEFENIDLGFEERFKRYLFEDVKSTNNTVAKYLKTLKTFMKYATEKGINKNLEYMKFRAKESEGEIFFLTWDELMNLYNLELESESLKRTRDIFCFGCFTGLRFSDIMNLKKENIRNDFIYIKTIKTRSENSIPLTKYSKAIIERNLDQDAETIFEPISNQKMNDRLKDLGKKAEMNDKIQIVRFSGSKRIEKSIYKHEALTTHVARKTFITNALMKGMQSEVIMDITSHSTHKAFKRYYKIIEDHKREAMLRVFE